MLTSYSGCYGLLSIISFLLLGLKYLFFQLLWALVFNIPQLCSFPKFILAWKEPPCLWSFPFPSCSPHPMGIWWKGIQVWLPFFKFRIILKGHTYSKVLHGISFSVLLSLPRTAFFNPWLVLFQGAYWNKLSASKVLFQNLLPK